MVHEHAVSVEDKIIEEINRMWQESYEREGKWLSLNELLADKNYFPDGPPQGPYGHRYKDTDGDHKVDPPFIPVAGLIKMRKLISGYEEILP